MMRHTSNERRQPPANAPRRSRAVARAAAAALAATLTAAGPAVAQTAVWDNTTGVWSDPARWGGTVPASDAATVLQFGSGAANFVSTNDLASPFVLNRIDASVNAGRYNAVTATTLANTLDFVAAGATQPSLNVTGGGTFRVGNHVRVGTNANLSLNVASSSYLVFSAGAAAAGTANQSVAPVSTNATVTVDGGGTVVWQSMSAQNVIVNNGLVTTDRDGDFLGADTTLTIGTNGTVDTGGFAEGYGSLSGTAAAATLRGRVNVGAASGTFAYAGRITDRAGGTAIPGFGTAGNTSNAGSVAKNGGHTFTLSGASTYTGATDVNAGTLVYAGDPVSATSSGGFATGTITSSPFGRGTVNLAGGTLRPDDGGSRTLVNAIAVAANTSSTLHVPAGAEFTNTGQITFNGTVTKTGTGLWRIGGGNGTRNNASVLNVNEGEVQLVDLAGGDLNATAINVNSGGTFTFGPSGGGGNPDLPNETVITTNEGGTVVWNVGEDFGGVALLGGTLRMGGNVNFAAAAPVEWRAGMVTLAGGTPSIGGGPGVINKTTAGTVTVNGIPLNNGGGLNIQEGVLETNTSIGDAGALTFGTATTSGTLRYSGFGGTLNKVTTLNAGGGTVDVTDGGALLAATGAIAGPGGLTKAGPGTLTLTANNTYAGTTTVAGGTLRVGQGGTTGAIVGNVVLDGGTLAFDRADAVTFAGAVSGTGGVTKVGSNTVNLTGPLSYAGVTTVESGTLRVSPFTTGVVTVGAGATLAVAGGATPGTLTASGVSLGSGGATLRFELPGGGGNPTAPLLNVTAPDGLSLNGGTHTLAVSSAGAFAVGSFTLVDYAGAPITGGFALAPLPARTQGGLVYDAADTSVKLNITGVDSIRWNGNVSPDWDAGTAVDVGGTNNWRLASNNAATNFVTNDVVLFDDTAAGPTDVTLTTTLQPAAVTVNNAAKAYTLQGGGAIGGAAGLAKQGAGTLTVLTNNTNTGGTTVSGGTLRIGNGGATGAIGSGNVVNNAAIVWDRADDVTYEGGVSGTGSLTKQGGGTLAFAGAYTLAGTTTLNGGTLTLRSNESYAVPGKVTGAGGLTKDGTGTVTLTGANDYAGGTRVVAGILQVGDGGTTGSLGTGPVAVDATLAFNRGDAHAYNGDVSGGGGVVHVGAGTATLGGTLTHAGPTVVQAGTLALTGNNTLAGAISVAAGGTLSLSGNNTLSGTTAVAVAGTLNVSAAGFDQTYARPLSGAGVVNKTGPGTLTLTANNNPFTGTLNVNGGTVVLADVSASGGDLGARDVVVNDGGTFQFGGDTGENPDLPDATFLTANPGGTIVWRVGEQIGGIHLQGGTLTFNGGGVTSNGATQNWSAGTVNGTAHAIGGGAVINKTTAGTVTVAGSATIGSTLDVQEGTVAFASAANLGSAAIRLGTAATAGTVEYQGATASRGGGVTLNGGGTVRVTQAAAALTLTGTISGTGALTKAGPGTLVLTGNNTFAGGATVASGSLIVNGQTGTNSGTGAGPVVVKAGAMLGGTGSIAGPVTVEGAVSPGASAGTMGVGSTTLTGGGTYRVEVSDAAGTAGAAAGWDLLQGRPATALAIGATSAAPFTIDLVSLTGAEPGVAAHFDPTRSYTWTVATFPGGVTGFDPAAVVVNPAGFANDLAGGTFSAAVTNGTDLTVVFTSAVPEPGSVGVLAAAAAGGLLARRRRPRA